MPLELSRPPEARGVLRRGQVLLEFALACFGLVMFIYVLLQSWVWLTGTIVRRQASFQHSRLDAGKRKTAGKKVPYRPGRDTPARFNLF